MFSSLREVKFKKIPKLFYTQSKIITVPTK